VRNVKKTSKFDVYIGRKNARFPSEFDYVFGNPFPISKDNDRAAVCKAHREWLLQEKQLLKSVRRNLKGKTLGCFCAPRACHGDFLALVANSDEFKYLDEEEDAGPMIEPKKSSSSIDVTLDDLLEASDLTPWLATGEPTPPKEDSPPPPAGPPGITDSQPTLIPPATHASQRIPAPVAPVQRIPAPVAPVQRIPAPAPVPQAPAPAAHHGGGPTKPPLPQFHVDPEMLKKVLAPGFRFTSLLWPSARRPPAPAPPAPVTMMAQDFLTFKPFTPPDPPMPDPHFTPQGSTPEPPQPYQPEPPQAYQPQPPQGFNQLAPEFTPAAQMGHGMNHHQFQPAGQHNLQFPLPNFAPNGFTPAPMPNGFNPAPNAFAPPPFGYQPPGFPTFQHHQFQNHHQQMGQQRHPHQESKDNHWTMES